MREQIVLDDKIKNTEPSTNQTWKFKFFSGPNTNQPCFGNLPHGFSHLQDLVNTDATPCVWVIAIYFFTFNKKTLYESKCKVSSKHFRKKYAAKQFLLLNYVIYQLGVDRLHKELDSYFSPFLTKFQHRMKQKGMQIE